MTKDVYPLSGVKRAEAAVARRDSGVRVVTAFKAHLTANNCDNAEFDDSLPMAFSKGLEHNAENGFVKDIVHFEKFVNSLTQPMGASETDPMFPADPGMSLLFKHADPSKSIKWRAWESPLAGMAYENEGPDPDNVSMAPAPKFGESELCAEMIEVYAMALVRDMSFAELADNNSKLVYVDPNKDPFDLASRDPYKIGAKHAKVSDLLEMMNSMNWFKSSQAVTTSLMGKPGISELEKSRQRARGEGGSPSVTVGSLFRGSSPGCLEGPYISQFLLRGAGAFGPGGDRRDPADGKVSFGAQWVNQRVSSNMPGVDWMTSWREWLAAQNGADLRGFDIPSGVQKFISTPRDLATYVHIDALYQAYFVACLSLLEEGVPTDVGFPEPDGKRRHNFATFGGPHILSLMTEVASRALRAVRRQKFQIHRRGRPERLAGMIAVGANKGAAEFGKAEAQMDSMLKELGVKLGGPETEITQILKWIDELNDRQNKRSRKNGKNGYEEDGTVLPAEPIAKGKNYLLPMAFPEGSPMHAAYGAGHATVAGACTTILKAFFGIYNSAGLQGPTSTSIPEVAKYAPLTMKELGLGGIFVPDDANGANLVDIEKEEDALTVEGELNKLAANIAIGRNFAGVHYYTDYYDSLRMGERVAVGMLLEHLCAHPEAVAMHLRGFDGESLRLSTPGDGTADLSVWKPDGSKSNKQDWWNLNVAEFPERPNIEAGGELLASASNWDA